MKLKNLVEGIAILRPYYTDPDGYNMGCEHDEFCMFPTDKPVSTEDLAKLIELDWFQPDVKVDDLTVGDYDPEESWCAFV